MIRTRNLASESILRLKTQAGTTWGDEYVADALKKLIPFLFRSFCNRLIFKLKKIGGTKTGSQLATLSATFSSAQAQPSS